MRVQTDVKPLTAHEILLDHEWNYNKKTRKYSIEFLIYPASVSQKEAIKAHNSICDYFAFNEDRNMKS